MAATAAPTRIFVEGFLIGQSQWSVSLEVLGSRAERGVLAGFGTEVRSPVRHQSPATLEQVRASVCRLDLVPNDMRQRRLDHLSGVIRSPRPPNPGSWT